MKQKTKKARDKMRVIIEKVDTDIGLYKLEFPKDGYSSVLYVYEISDIEAIRDACQEFLDSEDKQEKVDHVPNVGKKVDCNTCKYRYTLFSEEPCRLCLNYLKGIAKEKPKKLKLKLSKKELEMIQESICQLCDMPLIENGIKCDDCNYNLQKYIK